MHFGIDGTGVLGLGGIVAVMMLVTLAISVVRYNFFTRPQEDRELAEEREAEQREHEAQHEYDVPS